MPQTRDRPRPARRTLLAAAVTVLIGCGQRGPLFLPPPPPPPSGAAPAQRAQEAAAQQDQESTRQDDER